MKLMSKKEFSDKIRLLCAINGEGVLDSIKYFCEVNDIEMDTVSTMIDRQLKEVMKMEAQDKNMLPKETRVENEY